MKMKMMMAKKMMMMLIMEEYKEALSESKRLNLSSVEFGSPQEHQDEQVANDEDHDVFYDNYIYPHVSDDQGHRNLFNGDHNMEILFNDNHDSYDNNS